MPAVIPFIPLIASGIGAVGGAISAKKAANAQKNALAADQPAQQAQTAIAQQQRQQGSQLFQGGLPLLQRSGDFYSRLLSGDRQALRSTMAPERAEITDTYRGAEHSLDRSGVRGASRDVASANLARDKAGRLAGLVPAARTAAAGAAQSQGATMTAQGQGGVAGGGGTFSDLLSGSLGRQQLQFTQGEANQNRSAALGEDAGRLMTDFIKAYQNRNTGGGNATLTNNRYLSGG